MANLEIKESGTLKDKAAYLRFLQYGGSDFKGVLIFGRAAEKKSFMFENGKPFLPNQFFLEATLGKNLFEKNLINVDQFKKVKELEAAGKTFFQALLESTPTSADMILDMVLDTWIQDMAIVLGWDAGQFACVEFLPKEVTKVEIQKKFQHYLFRALILKNKKIKSKFTPGVRFEAGSLRELNFTLDDLVLNDFEKKVRGALKQLKNLANLAKELKSPEAEVAPIVLSLREIGFVYADVDPKPKSHPSAKIVMPEPLDDEFTLNDEKDFVAKIQRLDELDFFEILSVTREATPDIIQARYFTLAKKYHPDRVKVKTSVPRKEVERLFAKITEAYNTLSNNLLRKEYELKHSKEAAQHQELMAKILKSEGVFIDGKNLLNKGMLAGAVEKLQEAINLYDQEPEYHINMAWATFRLAVKDNRPGKISEAKKILVDAYNQDYFISEVAYYLGMIAKHENKFEQARNYFKSCLNAEPTHALASSELRLVEKKLSENKSKKK